MLKCEVTPTQMGAWDQEVLEFGSSLDSFLDLSLSLLPAGFSLPILFLMVNRQQNIVTLFHQQKNYLQSTSRLTLVWDSFCRTFSFLLLRFSSSLEDLRICGAEAACSTSRLFFT